MRTKPVPVRISCCAVPPNGSRLTAMKRRHNVTIAWALLVAGMALSPAMWADFEVTAPDGRRILLRDDGTWWYLDAKGKPSATPPVKEAAKAAPKEPAKEVAKAAPTEPGKEPAKEASKDPPKVVGEGVLHLDRKRGIGSICRFDLRLINNTNYPINSVGPSFSAYRADGVIYDTVLTLFQGLKPGDTQSREIVFRGISCENIVRLQVGGGDRCVMGDFDRWDIAPGQCLARVRIVPSKVVQFDKDQDTDKSADKDKSTDKDKGADKDKSADKSKSN